ncbi:MAG: cellulase family glycosylhydrolase [Isosphaeraceae bacterium]
MRSLHALIAAAVLAALSSSAVAAEKTFVRVSADGRGFVVGAKAEPFVPWGFNYDHDENSRLIEEYWEKEWPKVESDFAEMKDLGANVVRIHLQVDKFLRGPDDPNPAALERLGKLLDLSERLGLYLDLTGLACYRKKDAPAWYDALDESGRWKAQAAFWKAVAGKCRGRQAVFCYDLMNEPVVPGGKRKPGEWLGPPLGEFSFVQFITLDQAGRPRPEVARRWAETLSKAVREADPDHMVTIGLVDWSLKRPGLTSGFEPDAVAPSLDFLCVHLYPHRGKVDAALDVLKGFAAGSGGKPVVIEETFPLRCGFEDHAKFLDRSREEKLAAGWVGFYWGKTLEDLKKGKTIGDAITAGWLEIFRARVKPQ